MREEGEEVRTRRADEDAVETIVHAHVVCAALAVRAAQHRADAGSCGRAYRAGGGRQVGSPAARAPSGATVAIVEGGRRMLREVQLERFAARLDDVKEAHRRRSVSDARKRQSGGQARGCDGPEPRREQVSPIWPEPGEGVQVDAFAVGQVAVERDVLGLYDGAAVHRARRCELLAMLRVAREGPRDERGVRVEVVACDPERRRADRHPALAEDSR
eukprot:6160613-Prymnesium_polylepis.1